MTNPNETDFFDGVGGGAGAPGPVLKNVNDFVHGQIVEMYKRDYIPFGKKEVEVNEDGSKKQQLVIILQTTERNWANVNKVPKVDPTDPNSPEKPASEDDGKRALFVPQGKNIQFAIGRAATAAGVRLAVGGTLGVKVVELRPTDKGNDLKVHQAVYQAPQAADGFFPPDQQAAPSAPAAAPAATPEPTPAPAAATPTVTEDPWGTPSPSQGGGNEPPF